MKRVIMVFLIWRLLLFIPVFVGQKTIPYRPNSEHTRIRDYSSSKLWPWANFDGVHYLDIARDRYTNNARFFPLYPILTKLFGNSHFFSALLISNLSLLIALIMFYRLIRLDYSDNVAFSAIIFLLLFPTSFFFGAIYTESLFLLLAVSSFYFARKNRWFLAGLSAFFLSATRLVGTCIFPALLIELFVQKKSLQKGLVLILAPFGLIAYSVFNFRKLGDPMHFLKTHGELGNSRSVNSIALLPQTVFRYLKILATVPAGQYELWAALLELIFFIFILGILYFVWKKKIRASYQVFAWLCFLVPTLSGTFSGLPRYVADILLLNFQSNCI
jgi:hypothetical protein